MWGQTGRFLFFTLGNVPSVPRFPLDFPRFPSGEISLADPDGLRHCGGTLGKGGAGSLGETDRGEDIGRAGMGTRFAVDPCPRLVRNPMLQPEKGRDLRPFHDYVETWIPHCFTNFTSKDNFRIRSIAAIEPQGKHRHRAGAGHAVRFGLSGPAEIPLRTCFSQEASDGV